MHLIPFPLWRLINIKSTFSQEFLITFYSIAHSTAHNIGFENCPHKRILVTDTNNFVYLSQTDINKCQRMSWNFNIFIDHFTSDFIEKCFYTNECNLTRIIFRSYVHKLWNCCYFWCDSTSSSEYLKHFVPLLSNVKKESIQ